MKTYEITFITLEEPKDSQVKKDIETLGGRILSISSLGQKTFVYPIKKEKSGFYTTYVFELDPEKMQDFNRKLALEEEIVRHLIINAPIRDEDLTKPVKAKLDLEISPEVELMLEPETEIVAKPEQALQVESEKSKVKNEVEEKPKEEPEEKKVASSKKQVTSKEKKETKEKKAAEKPEAKTKKKEPETKPEESDEEERLEALDKKLEELLKE